MTAEDRLREMLLEKYGRKPSVIAEKCLLPRNRIARLLNGTTKGLTLDEAERVWLALKNRLLIPRS